MQKNIAAFLLVCALFIAPSFVHALSDIDPYSSASSCTSLSYNLRYQSRDSNTGGQVSDLQDFLQSQNYLNSEPTGYFGLLTLSAVKSFQRANGIDATGYVGPYTRAKISSLSCGASTNTNTSQASSNNSSNNSNSTRASISVVAPRAGDSFIAGTSMRVAYNYRNLLGSSMRVYLYSQSSTEIPGYTRTVSVAGASSGAGDFTLSLGSNLAPGSYAVNMCSEATPNPDVPFKSLCSHSDFFTVMAANNTVSTASQNLTITAPAAYTVWTVGNTYTFYWDSTGFPAGASGYIDIVGTGVYYRINNVPNTGSYTWTVGTINGSSVPTGTYSVKIIMNGIGDIVGPLTIAPRTTTSVPPVTAPPVSTFNITFPTSATTVQKGSTYNVAWTGTMAGSIPGAGYSVYLVLPGTPEASVYIAGVSPSQGSFSWTVPTDINAISGYKIKFVGTGSTPVYSQAFAIGASSSGGTNGGASGGSTTTPPPATPAPFVPTFRVTAPTAGATLPKGSMTTISWTGSFYPASENFMGNYPIYLIGGNLGSSGRYVGAGNSSSGSYSWYVPSDLPAAANYQITFNTPSVNAYNASAAFKVQ